MTAAQMAKKTMLPIVDPDRSQLGGSVGSRTHPYHVLHKQYDNPFVQDTVLS